MKNTHILFSLLLFICSVNKVAAQAFDHYKADSLIAALQGAKNKVAAQSFHDYKAYSSSSGKITAVKYNSDGSAFASGNEFGVIFVRDVISSYITHVLNSNSTDRLGNKLDKKSPPVNTLNFDVSNKYLAVTYTNGKVEVWDWANKKKTFEIEPTNDIDLGKTSSSIFAFFTVDNNFLIYGNGNGKVQLLPIAGKALPQILTNEYENTFCLDYSLNANSLIMGNEQTVKIIDVETKKKLFQFIACDSGVVTNVKFNAQYWQVACLCSDGTLSVFDVKTGEQLFSTNVSPQTSQVAFSPNGKYLAADDGEKKIIVWDMDSKKQTSTLIGHQTAIKCLDFDANSQHMLSGSSDCMVKMWLKTQVKEEEKSGN
jgi:WD40 repeat protein